MSPCVSIQSPFNTNTDLWPETFFHFQAYITFYYLLLNDWFFMSHKSDLSPLNTVGG